MGNDDPKAHSRERFSQYAHGYVTSETHSHGSDLDRLLEVAAPQSEWRGLDVATGGGHTALKIAPYVHHMIASDFALPMLEEAQTFIRSKDSQNVGFVAAEADNLPFANNVFDLVTCRVAAHHFPDIYRFVLESARVLKPGGKLVVQDHVLPEEKNAAEYIEAFETLRDPSHHRAYSEYGWRGMFLDADLTVDHAEILSREAKMIPWAERQGCAPDVIERLQVMMIQAPPLVSDFYHMKCAGTTDATFHHVYILIAGTKK